MTCAFCEKLKKASSGNLPNLIHEFPHSYLLLGDHQFYQGYCVLVTKDHYKEMTDLPGKIQAEFFQEMMTTHKLIQKVFRPEKMNMESLGNVVPHVHWHFFPRYADEAYFKKPPFLQMDLFSSAVPSEEKALELIEKMKSEISKL